MSITIPSNLESRFLEPPGWRWHFLKNANNKKLRTGNVSPENRTPDAVIVLLPGRTEYAEKYFEIASDLLKRNFGVWIMEWRGQGLSDRLIPGKPQHNHSPPFTQHIKDLHQFILEYVQPACARPGSHIPMVMLAHSMGANIGMRYLHRHPGVFEAAGLTAPLLGIPDLDKIPAGPFVAWALSALLGKSYAFGQKDWSPAPDPKDKVLYSSDPVRKEIYGAWFRENENLRVGGVTFGWIYNAFRSCLLLQKPEILKAIATPCLIALAGEERLVDNNAIRKAAAGMPRTRLIELAGSGHEILMERDDIRDQFLDAFMQILKETIFDRPERLKNRGEQGNVEAGRLTMLNQQEKDKIRLSDRILSALELSLEQKDIKIAEQLVRALEMSMTRNTGGGEFVERRDYPPEIERAMNKLYDLRDEQDSI